VAPHRRHDERFGAGLPDLLGHRPNHQLDVGDAPAPGRDRDALPWLDTTGQSAPGERVADRRRDVWQMLV
jgi:hypothetical protein